MLRQRGKHWYGETNADTRELVLRYSRSNANLAHEFASAVCTCSGAIFALALDDAQGAAVRKCIGCGAEHPIGDSSEYLEEAELEECACPCGHEAFEITVGVARYEGSQDVRWLYLGCRCVRCGLTAVYGDWKNEFIGYQALLARV